MLNFYKNLPIGAMKADLWRYLILYTYGGVYSDIDSVCNRPIDSWIYDLKLRNKEQVLLIALEHNNIYFCQWTILATANHPGMKHICNYVLLNYEKNGIDLTDPDFVFNTTGPSVWTDAIIDYLNLKPLITAKDVYNYYVLNKKEIENKGIYFIPFYTFTFNYVVNLVGSSTFSNDYESWKDESARIKKVRLV